MWVGGIVKKRIMGAPFRKKKEKEKRYRTK